MSDERFMSVALVLARRGLGRVWPNPAVGCVIVKEGRIVGRGTTQPTVHAETQALINAAHHAQDATVYVTLEPCCHHGKTPPCTESLIQARVARVVVACQDPDTRVNGQGLQHLQNAGIAVTLGVGQQQAQLINAGFFLRIQQKRPLISLKLATTLDSRIPSVSASTQWLTHPGTRHWSHGLRLRHDAILIGRGTVEIDNPMLTCRLPGIEHPRLVRIVLDSQARIPVTSHLVTTAHQFPTWIVVTENAVPERCTLLTEKGLHILKVSSDPQGRTRLQEVVSALAEAGITRLLVEGGPRVIASFLSAGLCDHVIWFRTPTLIGSEGQNAVDIFSRSSFEENLRFQTLLSHSLQQDHIEYYQKI